MNDNELSQIQSINPEAIQNDILKNKGIITEPCNMKEVFDSNHKALFEASPDGILLVTVESGKIIFGNQAIFKMLDYSPEELLQLSFSNIFTKEFYKESKVLLDSFKTHESNLLPKVPCVRKNGTVFYVDIKDLKIELEGIPYHLIYFTDITDKLLYEDALKESEERWKFAIDGSGLGLWDWYTSNNRAFFSKKWKEMLGYEDNEIGDTLDEWTKRVHPNDIERCFNDLDDHFRKKTEYYSNEHRILCKNGEYKWIHSRGKVIHWSDDGRPLRIIGTQADISQRKKFEEEIQSALKEKDILLKEIHHRVKNNLQIIVSLLSLQEDLITDINIQNIFQDVQSRIRSMAIMYENMYKTGKFETVDIKNYVDSMVKYLSNIFVKDKEQILIDLDIEPLELDMDTMVPVGLIISELFSNSLKYAFPNNNKGTISISTKKGDDNCVLVVSDNGVGLPDDFNPENLKSLGLRLVKIFVKQIKGTLEILKQERGVKFIIQFNRV